MTAEPKLPRGVLAEADTAVGAVISVDPGLVRRISRAALEAAIPLVRQAVLREAAKRILLLPGLSTGILCPVCHSRYVTCPDALNPRYRSDRWTCKKGHQWDKPDGPRLTTESLLRLLARGEPLPDLPPKEITCDR